MIKTIKALAPIGFINHTVKDLDNLSRHQKYRIALKYREFKYFIDKPKEFVIKQPAKDKLNGFKKTGFKVSKTGKLLVPLKGNTTVKIRGNGLEFSNSKNGRKEIVFTAKDVQQFREQVRKAIILHERQGGLFGFKIGDNAMASTLFVSADALNEYLINTMLPRMNISAEKFLPQISLVLYVRK